MKNNYWLSRKIEYVWVSSSDKVNINIGLSCGFKCTTTTVDDGGSPILRTKCINDPSGWNGPFDENLFNLRYGLVEKVAIGILIGAGELKREDYLDSIEYYRQFDAGPFECYCNFFNQVDP